MNSAGIVESFERHNADRNDKHTHKAEQLQAEVKTGKCYERMNAKRIADNFRFNVLPDNSNNCVKN